MKKIILSAVMLIAVSFACVAEAEAQQPKRINFAKGKNSIVIKAMTGPFGTTYVLRAKAGRKLILTLTPASVLGIKVETVGRFGEMVLLREESGGTYEVGLEETGDYTIFIGPLGRNPVTFTLRIKITKLTDI